MLKFSKTWLENRVSCKEKPTRFRVSLKIFVNIYQSLLNKRSKLGEKNKLLLDSKLDLFQSNLNILSYDDILH